MRFATLLLALAALPASGQPVYVVNQGGLYSEGATGSVSVVSENGDAIQLFRDDLRVGLASAAHYSDRLYLVAPEANAIEVIDLDTNERVGQITDGLSNPRHVAFVEEEYRPPRVVATRAYVSNQAEDGASYVLPIDLDTQDVGLPIYVEGRPEAISVTDAGWGDRAIVALGASGGADSLAVLDLRADSLVGYINIGCRARFVANGDFSENVLAFCEDTDEAVVVNHSTQEVVQRIAFGEDIGGVFGIGQGVGPGAPVPIFTRRSTPSSSSFLVITASGIAEVGLDRHTYEYGILRTVAIPEADTRPISAVAMGLYGWPLYLGRPDPENPFTAKGTVTIHDLDAYAGGVISGDAELLETHPAGIFPIHIATDERFYVAAEDDPEAVSLGLSLAGANPARHHTAVDLALDRPASVRVEVFDGLGRRVRTVTEGDRIPGVHRLRLGIEDLAPGTYVVRAVAEGRVASLPLTVVR